MQITRNRLISYTGATFTLFLILVAALSYFERQSDAANIKGFADAFWYTSQVIVTRSYGNLFPVTVYGRVIGLVFLVLSLLFYCLVIAVILSYFINLRRKQVRPS